MNEQLINSNSTDYIISKFNSIISRIDEIKSSLLSYESLKDIDLCYDDPQAIKLSVIKLQDTINLLKTKLNGYVDEIMSVDSTIRRNIEEIEIPTNFGVKSTISEFNIEETTSPSKTIDNSIENTSKNEEEAPKVEEESQKAKKMSNEETKILAENIKHIFDKIKFKRNRNSYKGINIQRENIKNISDSLSIVREQFTKSISDAWKGDTK